MHFLELFLFAIYTFIFQDSAIQISRFLIYYNIKLYLAFSISRKNKLFFFREIEIPYLFTGNIQPPTSSDLYTCVASNEGGISEANVTLVFSPNVATYVGDGEAVISWLLTGGVASGILIFLGNLK